MLAISLITGEKNIFSAGKKNANFESEIGVF